MGFKYFMDSFAGGLIAATRTVGDGIGKAGVAMHDSINDGLREILPQHVEQFVEERERIRGKRKT